MGQRAHDLSRFVAYRRFTAPSKQMGHAGAIVSGTRAPGQEERSGGGIPVGRPRPGRRNHVRRNSSKANID